MCGIAGIVFRDGQRPVEPSDLQAMARALRHRGPDDEGSLLEGSVGLTMRRLSVIDVGGGRQPIWNEDRSVAVVQNGEIYNFPDLRDDLARRGHHFSTRSDTETIVHLYEETGAVADLPARLHGMFAFALFDRARAILVLARDRAGKKPLYLYRDGAVLAFASELDALFAPALSFDRAPDPLSVDAYLARQYVPGPRTIFRRVRHLGPGSLLVLERTSAGWQEKPERRYWTIPAAPPMDGGSWRSFREAVDGCERLILDAVRKRLISDVPLGAFLSGGLDSSLIVAVMARAEAGRVRTFSIGFDDPALDESQAAARVARLLGTEHHALRMPAPGPENLAAILARCDQPLADPAIVPTWHLSRLARKSVTVALSGVGADEVFAGYHWSRRTLRRRAGRDDQVPREARRSLLGEPLRAALDRDEVNAEAADGAQHDGRRAAVEAVARPGMAPIAALQAADFTTWMPDDLLVKVDRMSMAHSLEVRCPYLDHRLVEAVLPGPDRFKIRWGRRKALLKAVARRYLPDDVVFRKKHGFQVPIEAYLRAGLGGMLRDLASPARLARQNLLDPAGVSGLLERFATDRALSRAVWKVLCLLVFWEARRGGAA